MRPSLTIGGLAFAAALGTSSSALAWGSSCSALYGPYGVLISGHTTNGASGKYYSGVLNFNGQCGVSGGEVTGGVNGAVSNTTVNGTYAVNADTSMTISLNVAGQGAPWTFIVGSEKTIGGATGIETDGSAVATIDLTGQLWLFGYGLRTLQGTYAVSCRGEPGGYSDLNYVTFDGAGHLSGTDVYNNGGFQGNLPYTGQYTVNADGSFAASLNGSFSVYTLNGVMDEATTEIKYTYAVQGLGEIVACSGRK